MKMHLAHNQNLFIELSEIIAVHVLVFKTNIRYKKDVMAIASALNTQTSILKWHIDREDIDKILRIESLLNNAHEIISTIQLAGYCCEELND